jgi:hypothetical protein
MNETQRMIDFFNARPQLIAEARQEAEAESRPVSQKLAFLAGREAHSWSYSQLDKVDFEEVAEMLPAAERDNII